MILQLSLFQIFFMALSIVGMSFSILYLFIGHPPQENEYEIPQTVAPDATATHQFATRKAATISLPQSSKSRARKKRRQASPDVIEVNFRDIGSNLDVAMDIIHLTREEKNRSDFTASTISNIFDLASSD